MIQQLDSKGEEMRARNYQLKMILFEIGVTQRHLAQQTRIPEAMVSMGINGKYNFDSEEKIRIANALKKPVVELFGQDLQ